MLGRPMRPLYASLNKIKSVAAKIKDRIFQTGLVASQGFTELPGVCPMFRKSIAYMTKHHFLFSTDEL
jgi:hypothetical protein